MFDTKEKIQTALRSERGTLMLVEEHLQLINMYNQSTDNLLVVLTRAEQLVDMVENKEKAIIDLSRQILQLNKEILQLKEFQGGD